VVALITGDILSQLGQDATAADSSVLNPEYILLSNHLTH
jgi:hypothetical protein